MRLNRRGDVEAEAGVRRGHFHSVNGCTSRAAPTSVPGLSGIWTVPRDDALVPIRGLGRVNRNKGRAAHGIRDQVHGRVEDGVIAVHPNMLHVETKVAEDLLVAGHGGLESLSCTKGRALGDLRYACVFNERLREAKVGEVDA